MALVQIIGPPGSGKTTSCEILQDFFGYPAYDIDRDRLAVPMHNVTGEIASQIGTTTDWHNTYSWQLSEAKVRSIQQKHLGEVAFVGGTVTDDFRLWDMFDEHAALFADAATIDSRLSQRPLGRFGNSAEERERVIARMGAKKEKAQRLGAVMIDGTLPPYRVIGQLLPLARFLS